MVTNKAVCTVLMCLGLSKNEYHYNKFRLGYRPMKWVGMSWYIDQYNGLLNDEVRPYFKGKFDV